MHKASYKFRLRPTAAQETLLSQTLELCRWTYNETLATRKNVWEQTKKTCSKYDTIKLLPQWKKTKPELEVVHSQVLQQVHERVDLAFRAFFQRVKKGEKKCGYPRFKGYGRYDSFTYPQTGFSLNPKGLQLSKMGLIVVLLHREISNVVIKRLTIKREAGNKWYAVFSVQLPVSTVKTSGSGMVGVDLGCKTFAVLSDGTTVSNPKFHQKAMKRIAKAQRRLQRNAKGTPGRAKARQILGKVYQKVTNQRTDFLHQTSRRLVNKYETIVFEDLYIRQIVETKPWHNLNRTIMDAGWDQFVFYCSYKAENAGGMVIKVNPRNTSKMCSRCGALMDKDLFIRVHQCGMCGLTMDRDLNASINVLRLGQQSLARVKNHA